MAMIAACDLTTAEVRSQYVKPLIREIVEKAGLTDHAAALGVSVPVSPPPSLPTATDAPPSSQPAADREVGTLFQEISTESKRKDGAGAKAEGEEFASGAPAPLRCYAELLEEASALCVYTTPQENAIVAAVAASSLLAFLIPQSHFQGFLRSYFAPPESTLSGDATVLSTLEERIVSAALPNCDHTSGGVFPYSASRMRSLVSDVDGFTSASLRRFLIQGLGSYLASGMAFDFHPKDVPSAYRECNQCHRVHLRAGVDLLRILAMAISPNPPPPGDEDDARTTAAATKTTSLSMEGDKGAGGETFVLDDIGHLANSTLPLSFQLSYSDRLQLVRLCSELLIPDGEDDALDSGCASEGNLSGGSGEGVDNCARLGSALDQLRSSLFGFASCCAHSEKDAAIAYGALANIAVIEGTTSSVQNEFQRLLNATLGSRSECLASALGDCLADMIARHNGSRYYADGAFARFVLGLLGRTIHDAVESCRANSVKEASFAEGSLFAYGYLVKHSAAKRRKTEVASSMPTEYKPYRLVALMKATRPLFYFLLGSNSTENKEKEEEKCLGSKGGASSKEETSLVSVEETARSLLIRSITLMLNYPRNLSVVKTAAESLALGLAYDGKYIDAPSNVRHLFKSTRLALDSASESADIVQALRPLIVSACRQSQIFAVSLFSYAVKAYPTNQRMSWKVVVLISGADPLLVHNRLSELKGCTQGSEERSQDFLTDQIRVHLSCAMTLQTCASPETIEHCVSLAGGVTNHWTLFRLVRCSFTTGNFGFARRILSQRGLPQACSQQRNFLWLSILQELARAEDILVEKGAIGISDSLEALNSCHSTLSSLGAMERTGPGRFGFQIDLLRIRIDYLNLAMVARSLCAEIVLTGGNNLPARSNLWRKNIPRSFVMLKSRYRDVYRLWGLHNCQQTRSVLRTMIGMCQLMSDLTNVIFSPSASSKRQGQGLNKGCHLKADERCPMGSLISRFQSQWEKIRMSHLSKDPNVIDFLDTMIRCPVPFPLGFFQVKSVPRSCVNISIGPELLPKRRSDNGSTDANGAEFVDVMPGLPFKLVVSGVIPKEFIRSANVEFSQVIAWRGIGYEGQLYEDDEAEDLHLKISVEGEVPLDLSAPNGSTMLRRCGQFVLPIFCGPLTEGFYKVRVKLGCRDVRCGEWIIPTTNQLELFLRVEEHS